MVDTSLSNFKIQTLKMDELIKQYEKEIEFLRLENKALMDIVSTVEDRIGVLKRKVKKMKGK